MATHEHEHYEHFGEALAHIDTQAAINAVRHAADNDMFRFPISIEAQGRVLDDISHELSGLYSASYEFLEVVREGQGWTEEQAILLGTGFDMAMIVLHELMRESRRSG